MITPLNNKKIAIVCDWLTNMGGAEKVILSLHRMFPEAPIYTTLYDKDRVRGFEKATIHTSYLQKIPFAKKKHQLFLSMMPLAIESLNLNDYDIVISSSHSVAKGIITKPETVHISYCHTPMRYAWEHWELESRLTQFPKFMHKSIRKRMHELRIWDRLSAERVDHFIVNSNYIGERVRKYYRKSSTVIHPPVNTDSFEIAQNPGDYYLMVGRMIPYKRFDLVIETFKKLGKRLIIAGTGPEESKLKKIVLRHSDSLPVIPSVPTTCHSERSEGICATCHSEPRRGDGIFAARDFDQYSVIPSPPKGGEACLPVRQGISFLGHVPDDQLSVLLSNCQALISPQLEDFGITTVECMASGRPVIAFGEGGAAETVIHNQTGILFEHQTIESLSQAIEDFENKDWDSKLIKKHAEKFSEERFRDEIVNFISTIMK